MKPHLLETLHCPLCQSPLNSSRKEGLECTHCHEVYHVQEGIPIFSPPPAGIIPSEKISRGPDVGTPWRKTNWRFLQQQINKLKSGSLIMDAGSGRGDFADALREHNVIALDVYPYPEVDIVCNLIEKNPFKPEQFDAVLLMNVLEHVEDSHAFLNTVSRILKPGGVVIVAIPFLVKIHQEPVDYVRYTHYALQKIGSSIGLETELLEGYYDPVFFMEEGIGNIRNAYTPTLSGSKRYLVRIIISTIQASTNILGRLLGAGQSVSPGEMRSKAPTGYQLVYRKPGNTVS